MHEADAFDRLEAGLRGAVRAAGKTPDPAPAPASARVRRPWARRRLPRRGGLLAAALALVVAGGGAVAATQVIDVGDPAPAPDPAPPRPDAGAGVAQGPAKVLKLRVSDPYGGPPWALRVFASSRGLDCVQVGQVVDGRFGRVLPGKGGRLQLRPISATPGQNSLCGGVTRNGYPVLRGLRTVQVTGGHGDPHQCGQHACPITAVRTIRYGLLGPAARRATYDPGQGRTPGPTMAIDGAHGGAYLFVVGTDPAPYAERERREDEMQARIRDAQRRLRAHGQSPEQALLQAMREARRGMAAGPRPVSSLNRVVDGVDATFSGGATLRVAGHGRTSGSLPGVTRAKASTPAAPAPAVRAPLRVTREGDVRTGTYVIRFRAPLAIRRADRHYTLTIAGHAGRDCSVRTGRGGGNATTSDIDRGANVTFRVPPSFGGARTSWCPGAYTLRVGYFAGSGTFRGRLVGTYAFTVPG